ncbi:hypothetical protein RINTHH_9770 [Richelia intracellularis HH01]|uniref:Uncharacterized protein n=1 Tax=Richelia intracellularis HH01 TaxID=1165094 RepID=M1WYY5_9NOST|nr:hypothetical protein RINTHH_9770 [Richelia intracellularis HH01]
MCYGLVYDISGQCQRVIDGAVETPITPLIITGFSKNGGLQVLGLILLTSIGKI